MITIVVRVWLPDRPGALGAVASRIGAVRGDVVGIEIIERGAGQVVDELTVELPDGSPIELLEVEIAQVEEVRIEEIRELGAGIVDPAIAALDALGRAAGAPSTEALLTVLADWLRVDWAAAVGGDDRLLAVGDGVPDAAWLEAYAAGAVGTPWTGHPPDLVLASIGPGQVFVAGRERPAFSTIERMRLERLLTVAGTSVARPAAAVLDGAEPVGVVPVAVGVGLGLEPAFQRPDGVELLD